MTKSYLLIAAVVVAVSVLTIADAGEDFSWIQTNNQEASCQGSIAECLADGEFEMDSEINRRMLATRRYIGYGALKPGNTPCYHRGASYYNCRPKAYANPYSRRCNHVSRCGRGG